MCTTDVHEVRGGPGTVVSAAAGGVAATLEAAGCADEPADDELEPSIHAPMTVRATTRAAGMARAPRNLMRRASYRPPVTRSWRPVPSEYRMLSRPAPRTRSASRTRMGSTVGQGGSGRAGPATAEREPVDRLGGPVRLPMCWACIAMSTTTISPPRAAARPVSAVPYLAGLDGLRALAVVAVMVYHANPGWLPGGFIGVEVFFVISGYLITLLLIGEHERTGRVALGSFWLRRARRLLPALFVLLAGITVYTAVFRRDALGQLRGDVIAALTYVSNWYQIWVGQGYTASGDFAPLRHLWSLAVEEQFYLLWPLVMMLLLRLGRRRLPTVSWVLLGVAVAITAVVAALFYGGPIGTPEVTPDAYWTIGGRAISKTDFLYLSTPTRATGLLLGAAFAMVWRPAALLRGPMRRRGPLLDVVAVIGLVSLGALSWYLHVVTADGADPWLFRGGFLATGLATLCVIAAVAHARAATGWLLGNAVFVWIGTRSYGLYLYHWPIFQGIRRVAGNALTFPQFAAAMVATVVVAELSYRFVETPVRHRAMRRAWRRLQRTGSEPGRRALAMATALVITFVAVAGASLATAQLKPNEIAVGQQQGAAFVGDPFAAPARTRDTGWSIERPRSSSSPRPRRPGRPRRPRRRRPPPRRRCRRRRCRRRRWPRPRLRPPWRRRCRRRPRPPPLRRRRPPRPPRWSRRHRPAIRAWRHRSPATRSVTP